MANLAVAGETIRQKVWISRLLPSARRQAGPASLFAPTSANGWTYDEAVVIERRHGD